MQHLENPCISGVSRMVDKRGREREREKIEITSDGIQTATDNA